DAVVLLAAVSANAAAGTPEPTPLAVPEPEPEPPGDADGGAEGSSVRPEPVPAERSPVVDTDARPPVPEPEPPAASLRGLARLEGRAGAGSLPTVDLGAAATLGLAHRRFRVELSGAGWLPRERTVAADARVRV